MNRDATSRGKEEVDHDDKGPQSRGPRKPVEDQKMKQFVGAA